MMTILIAALVPVGDAFAWSAQVRDVSTRDGNVDVDINIRLDQAELRTLDSVEGRAALATSLAAVWSPVYGPAAAHYISERISQARGWAGNWGVSIELTLRQSAVLPLGWQLHVFKGGGCDNEC